MKISINIDIKKDNNISKEKENEFNLNDSLLKNIDLSSLISSVVNNTKINK